MGLLSVNSLGRFDIKQFAKKCSAVKACALCGFHVRNIADLKCYHVYFFAVFILSSKYPAQEKRAGGQLHWKKAGKTVT